MTPVVTRTSNRLAAFRSHAPRAVGLSLVLLLLFGTARQIDAEVVQVAAPTGDRARDQASVRAALGAVASGGTVQFAFGTYLIGGSLSVATTSMSRSPSASMSANAGTASEP